MASIPFAFECDRVTGFGVAPANSYKCFGYITRLDGFGLAQPAAADLAVAVSYSGQPRYSGIAIRPPTAAGQPRTASVVGVLESFNWAGGVGDPVTVNFWCSQQNATAIKTAQQAALKTTAVRALGWWIANYDQATKQWFEQSYPMSAPAVTGVVAVKGNPELNVDLTPVLVADGIDVDVFKVSLSVQPAANQQYVLEFANAPAQSTAKSWGLVVGAAPAGSV